MYWAWGRVELESSKANRRDAGYGWSKVKMIKIPSLMLFVLFVLFFVPFVD